MQQREAADFIGSHLLDLIEIADGAELVDLARILKMGWLEAQHHTGDTPGSRQLRRRN